MGREIKRVPLDFDAPLNKVWNGYINPFYANHCSNCKECGGRGSTTALQRLKELVGLILLSGRDSIEGMAHPYFRECSALHYTHGLAVSKDMAELSGGLAGRPPRGFGHDAIDRWSATKKIIQAAGLKKKWGVCLACKGDGSIWDSRENKNKASHWRSKEPPKGKGYQLWETVSEGSPISPVFEQPEDLATWLVVSPDYKWKSNDAGVTKAQWIKFIQGPGFAMSGTFSVAKGVQNGVVAAVEGI